MRTLGSLCAVTALLSCAASVSARMPQPFIVTLDGTHYITYATSVEVLPAQQMVIAPGLRISNCRRPRGEPLADGDYSVVYTEAGDAIDGVSMQLQFGPTRIVVATQHGDVLCDGIATAGETGIGRVFRGDFDVDALPQPIPR